MQSGGLGVLTHQSANVVLEDGDPVEKDGAAVPAVVHGAPATPVRLPVVRVGRAHGVADREETETEIDRTRRRWTNGVKKR